MTSETIGLLVGQVYIGNDPFNHRFDTEREQFRRSYGDGTAAGLVSWKLRFVEQENRKSSLGTLSGRRAASGAAAYDYHVIFHIVSSLSSKPGRRQVGVGSG